MNKSDIQIDPNRNGLTDEQVDALREIHGWNEIPKGKSTSLLVVMFRQFSAPLVLILIAAAFIAFFIGETIDALAIAMVVLLNGILGFVQEWRAETALAALRSMVSPGAVVVRNGSARAIPAREIVPNDLVVIQTGDKSPADLTLIDSMQLTIDESALTGESIPVAKDAFGEAKSVYAGTSVLGGRGEGFVTHIGAYTEIGKIAHLTGSVGEKITHLQKDLAQLARQLGIAAVFIGAVVFVVGLGYGRDPIEMFKTGLSLAVAIVPEGLPAVVTVTLALGAAAMARQKALTRRLQAAETLGSASVICTDKTGTLTENMMTATNIWMEGQEYTVTGTGYDPSGHIEKDGIRVRYANDEFLAKLLDAAFNCNNARLVHEGHNWTLIGEPTEGALVTLAYKGWANLGDRQNIVSEIPFSSARKLMSVVVKKNDHHTIFSKGAPEQVIEVCQKILTPAGTVELTPAHIEGVQSAYSDMAARGLRVIALASGESEDGDAKEDELIFLGLVGLIDPPRPEVHQAIQDAIVAGIRVIMITGDSPITAQAIASQLGLGVSRRISGPELDELSDAELADALQKDVLFARVKPAHKMRIVDALQNQEHIVVMTGDGVNDAPALKLADIGVSMGQRGTDVAKDASDMILLDDNFATIIAAIREGRRQFDNLRKFVSYLLASNAGEVIAILANIMIGGPLVFLATQILWMNLVTDSVTAIALGLEKSEAGQMQRAPRKRNEPILGKRGLLLLIPFGLYTGGSSLWLFYHLLPQGEDYARTMAFAAMVVFEKFSVFAFRSLSQPCWRIGWFSNPTLLLALCVSLSAQVAAVYWAPLQVLLSTVSLELSDWGLILLMAAPLVIVPELIKTIQTYVRQHPVSVTS